MEKFTNRVEISVRSQFSNLHTTSDHPLISRQNGKIQFDNRLLWTARKMDNLVEKMFNAYRAGVLRETKAMRLTLGAAKSGHLIIASMHAAHATECLYRFCKMNFSKEMATFAQYQTDYLDRGKDFKTLSWSMAPVLTSENAPYYECPLVNPEPLVLCLDGLNKPVQRPPSPARKRPDASSVAPSDKQKESGPKKLEPEKKGYYYIEDSGSLQDVIDGLKNGNLTD